jgi:serine/threonine protein phosphatase PrpC
MGGHANGQDASRMAIESIYLDLAPRLTTQELPDEELTALLQQAVQSANQKLYRQNQQDHADMGCTMTAALVAGDEAHICNVGDSRTYLLHPGGELQRVTVDHSIVQSLVDAGVIQKDDVYTHPKRNQIYRSLGEKEVIEIDMYRQRVTPGDKLLLCCDGLWEMIRDNEIEMILGHTDDLPQASSKLIEMANEHGGVDNITAVVVKVTEEGKPAKRPGIESLASGPATLPKRAG